jgi:oligoendopeptidase F
MFSTLPTTSLEFMDLPWSQVEPYYLDLVGRSMGERTVFVWLSDWTRLSDLVQEAYARFKVALDRDTADPRAEIHYHTYLDGVFQASQAMEQKLKRKLLESGLEPAGFSVPLRKLRAEVAIYRDQNLPLLAEERKLASRYDKIVGAQTVQWQGEETTLPGLRRVLHDPDRSVRRSAWQFAAKRQLADRDAANEIWVQLMNLRRALAENTGLPNFRAYRWQQLARLDYTPQDCFQFQRAIEQAVVPAASRVYEKRRRRLSVDSLRPWDLDLDLYPVELPALPAYGSLDDLQRAAEGIFRRIDPQLGDYFRVLRLEGLLDLENRKGKAAGAYCMTFPTSHRPFLFMNAVGLASDLRTLLHESGHAFHSFERTSHQPYAPQRLSGLEFAEVASMAMELLASPYLLASQGGFYSERDAARFQIAHLERILLFWPYMAVVDAFQHWVYENHTAAMDPVNCDAHWLDLWQRFLPAVDWSGLEVEAMTGWHRKQHIFRYPFYYVEYGLAQLGAVQVWRNALQNPAGAVRAYRQSLTMGGTATLPQLYAAAGANFAFDTASLKEAVDLIETTIERLENRLDE